MTTGHSKKRALLEWVQDGERLRVQSENLPYSMPFHLRDYLARDLGVVQPERVIPRDGERLLTRWGTLVWVALPGRERQWLLMEEATAAPPSRAMEEGAVLAELLRLVPHASLLGVLPTGLA